MKWEPMTRAAEIIRLVRGVGGEFKLNWNMEERGGPLFGFQVCHPTSAWSTLARLDPDIRKHRSEMMILLGAEMRN